MSGRGDSPGQGRPEGDLRSQDAGQDAPRSTLSVLWHDIECGTYVEDLPLWRELAAQARGPILDIGAGTGRVTLDLARRGHSVTALDVEADLLAALSDRAGGLPVETVCADASAFSLGRRDFALVIVPMQTIQLLGGPAGRAGLLRSALAHMAPGGLFAAALADALDGFDAEHTEPPDPDVAVVDGVRYASRPVAVREHGDAVTIERLRETLDGEGRRTATGDIVRLDRIDADGLAAEGRAAGFTPLPPRIVPATDEFVGSKVVMLRA